MPRVFLCASPSVVTERRRAEGAVAEQAERARDGSPRSQRSGKHHLWFTPL